MELWGRCKFKKLQNNTVSGEGGERKQVLKSIENGTDNYMKHSNMFHRPTKDLAGQSIALIRILIISSMEILPRRTPMQNSWSIILKVLSAFIIFKYYYKYENPVRWHENMVKYGEMTLRRKNMIPL